MFGANLLKFFAVVLVTTSAVVTSAVPAVVDNNVEKRQIDSIISQVTNGAASVVTHDIPNAVSSATSLAGSIGNVITSNGAGIVEYLTSQGGSAFTVVTSVGGEGFTLATSGAGVVTSKFGSIYTVATAAAQSTGTSNAAPGLVPFTVTSSVLIQIATVICSTVIGAYITL